MDKDERIALWEDAGRMCHYCDRPVGRPGTKQGAQIDHVVARRCGGSDDPGNLVVSCKRCNREKGIKPYRQYLTERLRQAEKQVNRLKELLDRV